MKAFRTITCLAAALLACIGAKAQFVNRLGADEEAFAVYAKARANVYDPANIAIGDSLYRVGEKRGDPKIMILGLNLQGRPLVAQGDSTALNEVARKVEALYAEHPSEVGDVYYTFFFEHIETILQAGENFEATMLARELARDAEADGNPYGRFVAYRALAHVYVFRNNIEMCVNTLADALEYAESVDIKAPGDLLMTKIQYVQYLSYIKGREKESLALMNELEKDPLMGQVLATNPLFLSSMKANAYFSMQDEADYIREYEQMTQNPYYEAVIEPERQYMYKGYYLVCTGRYNEALAMADSVQNPTYSYDIKQTAYAGKGDWKAVNEILQYRLDNQAEIFRVYQSEDLAVLDAELNNGALREAAQRSKMKLQQNMFIFMIALLMLLAAFFALSTSRSNRHIQELKEANEVKDRFVQNMSHEVRTPLNAITGFSQLLAMPDGTLSEEEKEEFSEYVINNSNMLTMLVDDILNSADISSGNYRINPSQCSVKDICTAAIKGSEHHIRQGVTLDCGSTLPEGFTMYTDPLRVQQILFNLLSNAGKNTTEGSVRLLTSAADGKVEFAVEDTGCGIPADKAEAIFERFYKLDSFKQGTGMGLSICREIAAKLGGTVTLDTSYSGGARFVLSLPGKLETQTTQA